MPVRRPPGPPGRLLLGNLPEFARDLLGFFTACAKQYGDIVSMRLGRRPAYLVNSPALVEAVLVTRHRNFVKHSFFWRHVEAIFGRGLLTSEGDFWLRQRRLLAPAFHHDRIQAYGQVMVDRAERMLEGWRDGEIRDVHPDMMHLTLEIVAKALFDAEVTADVDEVGEALDTVLEQVAARFRRPFGIPDWIPTPGNRRYRRGVARLERVVYRIIAEHRARRAPGTDLLSVLMSIRDDAGRGMSERQLRDESVTLLLAGHETTALVLSWTWVLLARHPEVSRMLERELERTLGDRPPSLSDLPALRYTEAVILESMRLFPPAYAIGREAVSDGELGGYPVPAGTTIFMSPWVMHRDARFYDDPERFAPERWMDGLAERLPRFAYLPFGGGPRVCIGNRFAMMEAVLILATVARRFRLALAPGCAPTPFPTITLRPAGGVRMRLAARRQLSSP